MITSSCGSTRRSSMTRRSIAVVRSCTRRQRSSMPDAMRVAPVAFAELERLLAGEPEAQVIVCSGIRAHSSAFNSAYPRSSNAGHGLVDERCDPPVDPPLRPLRRERRLHERPVAPVLLAHHLEDALAEHQGGEAGVERGGEDVVLAEDDVVGLEREARSRPAPRAAGSARRARNRGARATEPLCTGAFARSSANAGYGSSTRMPPSVAITWRSTS